MIHDYYLNKIQAGDIDARSTRKKKDLDIQAFYPQADHLKALPWWSVLIKVGFTLKKPYTSKDELLGLESKTLFKWDQNENKKDKYKKIKKVFNSFIKTKDKDKNNKDAKKSTEQIEFKPDPERIVWTIAGAIAGEIVKESPLVWIRINGQDQKLLGLINENTKEVKEVVFFENPIVRDTLTGLAMVRPSTWKGHLRFAAGKVERDGGSQIIKRLFGDTQGQALRGRLYFYPTFFTDEPKREVITPLDRATRTPARGPIAIEVMKPESKGDFYLLYVPWPEGKDLSKEQVREDLRFLAEAMKLMFYTYGFSAKKTSGWGVIKESVEGEVWIVPDRVDDPINFSDLEGLYQELEQYFGGENESA